MLSAKKKPRQLQISDDEDESQDGGKTSEADLGARNDDREERVPHVGDVGSPKVSGLMGEAEDDDDDFVPFSKHLTSAQYPV